MVRSQRQGGGQWTRLGVFGFEAGIEHWIELSDQGNGGVVADAAYLVKKAQVYDSYSWAPGLPSAGDYAVYAKWAADAGRASDAVYGIYHAGGLAEVAQDQRAGAGQWRYLGTYAFDPAGSPLVVLAGGSDGTLSADAIRFVGAGPAPADLRFVLGDHLGTPQKLTDNTGALVWDRIQTPFGLDHSVTGPAATPVRFPGQYADSESGLSYNYFRDYDPSLGRYIQSDPIGLAGGLNTYGYVGGNPLGYIDPTGENARAMQFAPIAGAGAALAAAAAQHCIDNGIIPSSSPSWPSGVPQVPVSSVGGVPGGVFSEGGTDKEDGSGGSAESGSKSGGKSGGRAPAKEASLTPNKNLQTGSDLSLEDAVEEVKAGGDVMAKDRKTARDIARKAGGGEPIHEPAHAKADHSARPHYHPATSFGTRLPGHVFY